MTTELPRETRELLSSALHHPEGAGPLWDAHLESAAALYQVKPARLEALRRELPVAPEAHVSRALICDVAPRLQVTERRATPPDALELISLAATRPDGLDVLLRAPLETAAILFGAHVFAVEEARRLLEQGAAGRA